MVSTPRTDSYRYSIVAGFSSVTPLAQIEIHLGPTKLQPINISQGGVALLMDPSIQASAGDILDVSVLIRDRAFPVKIEIKSLKSARASCEFIDPARNFISALREFLKPKFLATTLVYREDLSRHEDVKNWVEGTGEVQVFVGQNQTAIFCWLGAERTLKKFLSVAGDLVFEWRLGVGLRTGRLIDDSHVAESTRVEVASGQDHGMEPIGPGLEKDVRWDRHADQAILHYFADIFLAWINSDSALDFVERLTNDRLEDDEGLKLPNIIRS